MRRPTSGFTLLELIVVLALLGLATALVAPSGFRTIETWRRASDIDAALGSIASLSAQAQQSGRTIEFASGTVPGGQLAEMPPNWAVTFAAPLLVQANGACNATTGELVGEDGYRQPFEVDSPFCRTRRIEAEGR